MPNTREKLIELCEKALNYDGTGREIRFTGGDVTPCLIANGITMQEWISVKDRLPEFGKRVLILGNRKDGQFIYIDQICADGNWLLVNWEVTHWMPLPQPPKGE